jgi:hypothetical protein
MFHAPVLITVYNRIDHFKKCIASLANNIDADKTPLYVAIDAPYRDLDIQVNNEITEFSKKIIGFKYVEVIKREKNVGAVINARMARDHIFAKYDRLIRSEDDNLFSPYFLKFINDGLNFYRDNQKIFSICGYNEPIDLEDVIGGDDAYIRKGFSSFGSGFWRDKLSVVEPEAKSFYYDLVLPHKKLKFIRSVGSNIYLGLLVSKRRNTIYPDMTYIYHIYKNNLFSVHPKKTLVRNIGQDGSGLHSGINLVLQNQDIFYGELNVKKIAQIQYENKSIRTRLNSYHRQNRIALVKYILYYYYNYIRVLGS